MKRLSFITGAFGQDAYYLSKILKDAYNENVVGIARRSRDRIPIDLSDRFDHIIECDVASPECKDLILEYACGNDFDLYHLAAQSHVGTSFVDPSETYRTNIRGTVNMLDTMIDQGGSIYIASSSEVFGNSSTVQGKFTPMLPVSPYGVSKKLCIDLAKMYAHTYDVDARVGILFNHESPMRGRNFVTRRIIDQLMAVKRGEMDSITLGNVDAARDWGFAPDFMEYIAAWMHQPANSDMVRCIGTGETHTVREFVEIAAEIMGIPDIKININKMLFRKNDIKQLCCSKTEVIISKTSFRQLVEIMVKS